MPQRHNTVVTVFLYALLQRVTKFQISLALTTIDSAADIFTPQSHWDKSLTMRVPVVGKLEIIPCKKAWMKYKDHFLVFFTARENHFFRDGHPKLTVCVEEIDIIKRFQLIFYPQENIKPFQCCIGPRLRFLENPVYTRVVFFAIQVIRIGKHKIVHFTLF